MIRVYVLTPITTRPWRFGGCLGLYMPLQEVYNQISIILAKYYRYHTSNITIGTQVQLDSFLGHFFLKSSACGFEASTP